MGNSWFSTRVIPPIMPLSLLFCDTNILPGQRGRHIYRSLRQLLLLKRIICPSFRNCSHWSPWKWAQMLSVIKFNVKPIIECTDASWYLRWRNCKLGHFLFVNLNSDISYWHGLCQFLGRRNVAAWQSSPSQGRYMMSQKAANLMEKKVD